ncbi:hypothetical protein E2C01_021265 [Portunus trituberculatus]|uniref:Uncharacterized protein n=1 Tax=Portunus trituberculatus TaxID=210409 RepID=A0A5B7E257_PORTR|nr:hypothetical protein [Portunus trituberculatus]
MASPRTRRALAEIKPRDENSAHWNRARLTTADPRLFFLCKREWCQGQQNVREKRPTGTAGSLKGQKSHPKFRDKCLDTSLLKEVKS